MNTDINTVRAFRRSASDGYCWLLDHGSTAGISSWIRQYIRYPCEYFKKTQHDADQQSGCTGSNLVIIALGVLYYVVFYKEYKIIALVALGMFYGCSSSYGR